MNKSDINKFIIEHVMDRNGTTVVCDCPNCGKSAKRRDFEACHTGSINQHSILNCKHCHHHECDQDDGMCSFCDTRYNKAEEENVLSLAATGELLNLSESILNDDTGVAIASVFRDIDKLIKEKGSLVDFSHFYFNDEQLNCDNFHNSLLQSIRDRHFATWLDNQIKLAHVELADL